MARHNAPTCVPSLILAQVAMRDQHASWAISRTWPAKQQETALIFGISAWLVPPPRPHSRRGRMAINSRAHVFFPVLPLLKDKYCSVNALQRLCSMLSLHILPCGWDVIFLSSTNKPLYQSIRPHICHQRCSVFD